ncbi:hypothetical protein N480_06590 [Pseudoalteromonas luteoviolacea S2607]|nr:hypothetical protein N480_06590 [Pseudoalteromonas luteoviolacea S2607]
MAHNLFNYQYWRDYWHSLSSSAYLSISVWYQLYPRYFMDSINTSDQRDSSVLGWYDLQQKLPEIFNSRAVEVTLSVVFRSVTSGAIVN